MWSHLEIPVYYNPRPPEAALLSSYIWTLTAWRGFGVALPEPTRPTGPRRDGRGLQFPACLAEGRTAAGAGPGPGTATPASGRAGRSGGAELRWREKSSRMWRSWGEGVGGRWTRWRRGPPPPSPTRGGGPPGAGRRSCSATPAEARAEVWRSRRTWRPSFWPGVAARASP